MIPAGSDMSEYYQILQIQSSDPDDGRKHRPKHVGLPRNNKLNYIYIFLVAFIRRLKTSDQMIPLYRVAQLRGNET